MLNWHRDPDYETRMLAKRIEIEKIRNEIEQIAIDTELIRRDTERIRRDSERIRSETEQLRRENARLKALNALTRERFFAPGSWPTPATTPEADSGTSSS